MGFEYSSSSYTKHLTLHSLKFIAVGELELKIRTQLNVDSMFFLISKKKVLLSLGQETDAFIELNQNSL